MILEAIMAPEVLLGHHPDVLLEKLVHALGIGHGIVAREIGQGGFDHDPEPLASRQSSNKERDNRGPAGLGQPAQSQMGRCRVSEKGDLGAVFPCVALIRGIPDRDIVGQRVEQHPDIVPGDRDPRPSPSSLTHEVIQHRIVPGSIESTDRDFAADESGADLERGEMASEQKRTPAAGQGPLKVLEPLDRNRGEPFIGSPPAHGRFDEAPAECPEMSPGESADLPGGFPRETSSQIVAGNRPSPWLKGRIKQPETSTRRRFTGVGQLTGRIHQGRSRPEGPVPRFPQSRRGMGCLQRSGGSNMNRMV